MVKSCFQGSRTQRPDNPFGSLAAAHQFDERACAIAQPDVVNAGRRFYGEKSTTGSAAYRALMAAGICATVSKL